MDEKIKEQIEAKLRYYPQLKSKIKLQISKIATQLNYSAKAINYAKVPGGITSAFYSDVEQYVIDKLDKYPKLAEMIMEKNRIEDALECLTGKERRLVKYKYFERLPDIEIGIRLKKIDEQLYGEENKQYINDYSVPTIQRIKNQVLEKLHEIGFCEA